MVLILSIDIGKKNFSYSIIDFDTKDIINIQKYKINYFDRYQIDSSCTEKFKLYLNQIYKSCKINKLELLDLTKNTDNKKVLDYKIFYNLKDKLDKVDFKDIEITLIERQMSFRGKANTWAVKLAAGLYMYLAIRYPKMYIIDYPAYHKTQVLGQPKIEKKLKTKIKFVSNTPYQRKKWSKLLFKYIIEENYTKDIMDKYMSFKPKLDDISDTVLQAFSFISLYYFDCKKF